MMHPALAGLCSARWTDEILDEWTRSILAKHAGVSPESVARCRTFMNSHTGDALVVGYEYRTPTLTLPDPDDRHVLAAAIHGRATAIVTFNLKDFPDEILSTYGIEAIHPDEFVVRLLMSRPTEVVEAIRTQRLQLTRPPGRCRGVSDAVGTTGPSADGYASRPIRRSTLTNSASDDPASLDSASHR